MTNNTIKRSTWYLGLDIGTSSVGWAVTDEQYNIPRLRGQRAWGVRLFEEASTSAERRAHRTARRRYYRRAERLRYLRQIFAPYIMPIDQGFFDRMADSFLWPDDKRQDNTRNDENKNSLFNDSDYTDADYYADFPTIFHLRDYLMAPKVHIERHRHSDWQPKCIDARHYYLACHNIIKFRGHFLLEGEIEIDNTNTEEKYNELYDILQQELQENLNFEFDCLSEGTDKNSEGSVDSDNIHGTDFSEALLEMVSTKGRLSNKKNRIKSLNIKTDADEDSREETDKSAKLIAQFIIGSKVDFAKIAQCEDKAEIQLGQGTTTDDKLAELPNIIGANWQLILQTCKGIYDIGVARQIIGEHTSLSESYIALFDKYQKELELYNRSEPKERKKNGKQKEPIHKLDESRTVIDEDGKEKVEKDIAKPKLRGYYKGAVPMQLHLAELKKILASFGEDSRYGDFKEATTSFTDDPSNELDKNKVIKLLTHRVPYYVGPLQAEQSQKNKQAQTERQKPWIERLPSQLQNGKTAKIYPWNFNQVVDKAKSAENFIKRMANKCSYLVNEPCLPKCSVLYQKYMILDELNKLKLNGKSIDVATKQTLFNELFMKTTNIKLSTIKEWFAVRGCDDDVAIGDSAGLGGTINHKMTSYFKFRHIFGDNTDKLLPKIEEVILAHTILPDDREMLQERISTIFGAEIESGLIDDDSLKKISHFSFSKWGNFSAKLLDGITATINGTPTTIIDALWQTNCNFMELAAGEGPFSEVIATYQKQTGAKSPDALIEDSYASVPVKRACRQAIKIVDELEQIIGCKPAKVFIEAPRSNEVSKRTENRKAQLDNIYKNIKDDVREELASYDNADLKPKAIYLYFLQNGRCAYSGETLDLGNLTNTCDIDHIVPQAMIKDDSFDNLVLVKKELNRAKSDTYPLNTVRLIDFERMLPTWKVWHKNGMMSDKKYRSLSRTSLSMDEIAGFINRQLVETSQTTKMVMNILKLVMPDTEIVYQKAETVAEFKREWAQYEGKMLTSRYQAANGETKIEQRFVPWLYLDSKRLEDSEGNPAWDARGEKKIKKLIKPQFIKVRDLNDLHHAKDAYLNIVVGNVYSTKFTNNPRKWLRDTYGDKPEAVKLNMRTVMYDDRKVLANGIRGEVKMIADRNGVVVWSNECLETVIKTYARNDILVTVRAFEKHGAIYDQKPLAYEEKQIRFPRKKGLDVKKYGGYTGSYTVYFSYIKTAEGKKRFAAIPLRYKDKPAKYLNAEFPGHEILVQRVPIKSTLIVNGHPVTLDGSSGTSMLCSNLKSLLLPNDDALYLNRVIKTKEKMATTRGYLADGVRDRVSCEKNIELYKKFIALAHGAYSKRPSIKSVTELLDTSAESFNALNLSDQVSMLTNILKLFLRVPFSSSAVDCTMIGGKKNVGNTTFSTYEENVKIVIPSVTGLYKKIIDLNCLGHEDNRDIQMNPDPKRYASGEEAMRDILCDE